MSSNLYSILSNLAPDKLKELSFYINSGINTNSLQLKKLFNHIILYYPAFNDKSLEKNHISKNVLRTNKPVTDSVLRIYFSKLTHLVCSYLFLDNKLKNEIEYNLFLLNEFSLGDFKQHFENAKNRCDNYFTKLGEDSESEYFRYVFESKKLNHKISKRTKKNIEDGENDRKLLYKLSTHLSLYYFCELITVYVNYVIAKGNLNITDKLSGNELFNRSYIHTLYDSISKQDKQNLILKLYFKLFKLFDKPGKISLYEDYRKFFLQHKGKLSEKEVKFHYTKLISYCIIKNRDTEFSQNLNNDLLQYYEIFLEHKYYINKKTKYLPQSLFRDIVLACERGLDKSKLENLINLYIKELQPGIRIDLKNYAKSFLCFLKSDYKNSLKYISRVPFTYTKFVLDLKRLSVMNHFELKQYDKFENAVEALRQLVLKNKTLSEKQTTRLKSFGYYIKRLHLNRWKKNEIEFLNNKIENEDWFHSKEWVKAKYKEILNPNL